MSALIFGRAPIAAALVKAEKVRRVGIAVGSEQIFGEDAFFEELPEQDALKRFQI